jgi:hypothetical protein
MTHEEAKQKLILAGRVLVAEGQDDFTRAGAGPAFAVLHEAPQHQRALATSLIAVGDVNINRVRRVRFHRPSGLGRPFALRDLHQRGHMNDAARAEPGGLRRFKLVTKSRCPVIALKFPVTLQNADEKHRASTDERSGRQGRALRAPARAWP